MTQTLERALKDLERVKDLHKYLKRKKIKGGFLCTNCPIAMILQEKTGKSVFVNTSEARCTGMKTFGWVLLPANVRDFVRHYDLNVYPDLVAVRTFS